MPRDDPSYLYQQPSVHLCSAWQQLPVQPTVPSTQSSQPQQPPLYLHPLSFLQHRPRRWEAAWEAGGTHLPSMLPDEQRYSKSRSDTASEASPSGQVSGAGL